MHLHEGCKAACPLGFTPLSKVYRGRSMLICLWSVLEGWLACMLAPTAAVMRPLGEAPYPQKLPLRVQPETVSCRRWKTDLQLNGKGKEGSRLLALRLFPTATDLLKCGIALCLSPGCFACPASLLILLFKAASLYPELPVDLVSALAASGTDG